MKLNTFITVVVVSLFINVVFSEVRAQNSGNSNGLPLVYDPLTKKYFIGGSSKFMLKQSEQSSFIDRIEVSVDKGEFRPYGEAVQFKEEGKHTLKFRAVTPVNNWSPVQFVEVFVDLNAPTTEVKFPDEKFYKDLKESYVAVNSPLTLVSQDNLSGVASIQYSWDGVAFNDYTKPITLDKTGKRTLWYKSTDRVGNSEMVKKVDLVVDGMAPTSTLSLVGQTKSIIMMNGQNYMSDSVPVSIEASDDISQVKQIWVSVDGAKHTQYIKPLYFLQEGPHSLSYFAVDNVGNKEPEKSIKLYAVSTPPKTSVVTTGKIVNTGGINYATRDFQLKLEAANNTVGLERIEIKVDNDVDFKTYLEPLRFKDTGFHTVNYRSIDRVGTTEPTKSYIVNISDAAPDTTIATAQPLVQRGNITYSPSPNVLTFNVSNSAVGVDKTLVSINDGAFVPYQGPITLQNDHKIYKVSYKSLDKLGNEETVKNVTFHMISSIPIVDLFISNGKSSEEQVRTDYLEQPDGAPAKEIHPRKPASVSPTKSVR